jgi:protein phosphatase 1 regulatory subunit 37
MLATPPITPPTPGAAPPPSPADALKQAKALTRELSTVIQATEDPGRMEELLDVNDTLTALVARVPPPGRPTLTLQGLGLKWAPGAGQAVSSPALGNGHSPTGLGAGGQGDAGGGGAANGHVNMGEEDDDAPTTPRVDKGKARAVPEPEEPEKVLSPTLLLGDDEDDEDGEGRLHFSPVEDGEDDDGETVIGASPTNR